MTLSDLRGHDSYLNLSNPRSIGKYGVYWLKYDYTGMKKVRVYTVVINVLSMPTDFSQLQEHTL